MTPGDFSWREITLSVGGIGTVCTWLVMHNKAKSAAKRDIHDDRAHEAETDLHVDLLKNLRTDRDEANAARDYWQKQAQDAWAYRITDATRIATVEAENKFLTHELANLQTAFGLVKTHNERLREDMGSMRDELRKMRAQIEEMTVRYGSKPPLRIRTDYGSLDEEPGQ